MIYSCKGKCKLGIHASLPMNMNMNKHINNLYTYVYTFRIPK